MNIKMALTTIIAFLSIILLRGSQQQPVGKDIVSKKSVTSEAMVSSPSTKAVIYSAPYSVVRSAEATRALTLRKLNKIDPMTMTIESSDASFAPVFVSKEDENDAKSSEADTDSDEDSAESTTVTTKVEDA